MIDHAVLDAWRNRPARERWLIGLPAAALLIAVVYVGVWEPLSGSIARLRQNLPEAAARRELMRAQTTELRAPARAGIPVLDLALVQAAIERRELKSAQPSLEAAGDKRVRLAFARVPFLAVWPLLQDLQNDKGIRIISMRVDRLDAANARLEAILGVGER